MRCSISVVFSTAIIFGIFNALTVSAIPYNSQRSTNLTTRDLGANYIRSHLSNSSIAADSKFDKHRLQHQARALPDSMLPGEPAGNKLAWYDLQIKMKVLERLIKRHDDNYIFPDAPKGPLLGEFWSNLDVSMLIDYIEFLIEVWQALEKRETPPQASHFQMHLEVPNKQDLQNRCNWLKEELKQY
ncbi:hypothetical protein BC835DRAFT_1530669 [Cytidiella melzeri]|nr:hypothetical protein BC835DRAFT_1530669 [Cytidiella melzeri]